MSGMHFSEVQKTTETAKALFHRWNELVDDQRSSNKEEFDWTTNELRNSLRSIEWDLEDLEETINIFLTGQMKRNDVLMCLLCD